MKQFNRTQNIALKANTKKISNGTKIKVSLTPYDNEKKSLGKIKKAQAEVQDNVAKYVFNVEGFGKELGLDPNKIGFIGAWIDSDNDGKVDSDEEIMLEIIEKEVLIVVGTEQHDFDYGMALAFPAQAVREVRENYPSHTHLTIIMFTDGYTSLSLDIIKRDAKSWNPTIYFKKINSTAELIKYINEGDATVKRSTTKIETVKIFSHGYPSNLVFGLDGKNGDIQQFGIGDVPKLKLSSFVTTDPSIYSYACRTGNLGLLSAISYDDTTWREEVKPQNSLAQKLANHLDAKVYAYITRSDYNPTWKDDGDTSGYKATRMTIENEKINATAKQTFKILTMRQRNNWDEMIWNTKGAYKPPIGGTTPSGLPTGLFLFQKDKEEIKAGK
ncbi:MAG: hypothetical protein PHQ90_11565 [Sulfuricurvum sp.]|uniref:hypothetical protein n=1 Tax=Sulfuricurvum sp. TaxID=2025608 RepID=UPI002637C589|nr:hypothetical protein [Sulfuricurvum sp.]MDD2369933.1 hypothetical protein [Sulfuricurvum sp.]MDD5118930.1 hypothetical protein [Sulfuricurvum sp.]